jgi:hypothetical protein
MLKQVQDDGEWNTISAHPELVEGLFFSLRTW